MSSLPSYLLCLPSVLSSLFRCFAFRKCCSFNFFAHKFFVSSIFFVHSCILRTLFSCPHVRFFCSFFFILCLFFSFKQAPTFLSLSFVFYFIVPLWGKRCMPAACCLPATHSLSSLAGMIGAQWPTVFLGTEHMRQLDE